MYISINKYTHSQDLSDSKACAYTTQQFCLLKPLPETLSLPHK